MAVDMDIEIPQFNGIDILKRIDINMIISMIESGVVGKLVEIESSEGDIVEVTVE